jgi:V/A-type H+-transporting ATPase subunit E
LPYSSGGITVAEKLQGLLEKIRTEGLEKAEAEKQKIIEDAKKEAKEITKKAQTEAEEIIKKAKEDAGNLEKRSETAVKQASRDILLKLKGELQARLENIVHNLSNESMNVEFMGELIKNMADSFTKKDSSSELTLEALTSPKDCEKLTELLKGSLAESFKETPEVFSSSDVGGGLKIGFKGSDVFFDFTDDAISDLICAYVSPKLAELLEPAKK